MIAYTIKQLVLFCLQNVVSKWRTNGWVLYTECVNATSRLLINIASGSCEQLSVFAGDRCARQEDYHHLCSCASAEGLPENPNPSGSWTWKKVQRQTCRLHCSGIFFYFWQTLCHLCALTLTNTMVHWFRDVKTNSLSGHWQIYIGFVS